MDREKDTLAAVAIGNESSERDREGDGKGPDEADEPDGVRAARVVGVDAQGDQECPFGGIETPKGELHATQIRLEKTARSACSDASNERPARRTATRSHVSAVPAAGVG